MPELPEVEALRLAVSSLILGKKILRACGGHPQVWDRGPQSPRQVLRALRGQRVRRVSRRGKWLLLELQTGTLLFHFRLNGRMLWEPPGAHIRHADLRLLFPHGALVFQDPRHLGKVRWSPNGTSSRDLPQLGWDPLDPAFTTHRLQEAICASRRPLKVLLTDQRRLAGLGNIYASEALWQAQLDPRRPGNTLRAQEIHRLHRAIVRVLRRALECCSKPLPALSEPNWWFAEVPLHVYGRRGKRCRRCGSQIWRFLLQGRPSYACPTCQK
jgi:formamidopyrimidine-DNA glycosylase